MAQGIKYFFTTPPVDTPEIKVRGIGIQEWMRPCIVDRSAGTGDYLFMFFHEPVVIRSSSGEEKVRPQNTLMLWPRAAGHYYGCKERRWNHSWVHCDGAAVGRMLVEERLPVGSPIEEVNPLIVEKCLLDLHNELRNDAPDEVIVINTLHTFLREVRRVVTHGRRKRAVPEGLLKAKWRIETEFDKRLTLMALAREASLSVPHFCAEFKKHFGAPPVEHLIAQRMRQAIYLLGDMNLSVGEVASQIGYEDIFYFSRLFKKRMGIGPSAFRQKLKG